MEQMADKQLCGQVWFVPLLLQSTNQAGKKGLELSTWDPKRCQRMQRKEALIRQNKHMTETDNWQISISKRPGRPRMTTKVDYHRVLSMVKKNPLTTSGQDSWRGRRVKTRLWTDETKINKSPGIEKESNRSWSKAYYSLKMEHLTIWSCPWVPDLIGSLAAKNF